MGEIGKLLAGAANAIQGAVGTTQRQTQDALGYTKSATPAPVPVPPPSQAMPAAPAPLDFLTDPSMFADQGMENIYDQQSLESPNVPEGPLGVNPAATQENPYGMNAINTPEEIAKEAQAEEEIGVTGDSFKPKKLDVLGQIADFFLQGRLSNAIKGQNMRAAIKGLTNEAEPDAVAKVIRRVATFDHKAATQMYENYVDNKRADEAARVLQEQRKLKLVDQFRGTYGAISESNDADGAYAQLLPHLRRKRDQLGLTDEDVPLPDEYDDLTAKAFYNGGIMPEKRERLKDADVRLEQGERKVDIAENRAEVQERQGDRRLTIAERNAATGERRVANSERMTDSRIEDIDSKVAGRGGTIRETITTKDKSGNSKSVTKTFNNGHIMYDPRNPRRAVRNVNGQWVRLVKHSNGNWYKDKVQ
jgi:hypothetical protein